MTWSATTGNKYAVYVPRARGGCRWVREKNTASMTVDIGGTRTSLAGTPGESHADRGRLAALRPQTPELRPRELLRHEGLRPRSFFISPIVSISLHVKS